MHLRGSNDLAPSIASVWRKFALGSDLEPTRKIEVPDWTLVIKREIHLSLKIVIFAVSLADALLLFHQNGS